MLDNVEGIVKCLKLVDIKYVGYSETFEWDEVQKRKK